MTLRELDPETAKKVTEELTAVLAKYNCEMGVTSNINILKRVEEPVLSPIQDVRPDDTATDNTSATPA